MTAEGIARIAKPADAEAIASVLYLAFAEFQSLYTASAFRATALSAERVLDRMGQGPMWVVETAYGISGTVSALREDRAARVRGMAVVPDQRGRRLSCRLFGALEEWAAAIGLETLVLSTTPFLVAAIRFYEGAGFLPSADGPSDLHGTPLISMCKSLHPAGR